MQPERDDEVGHKKPPKHSRFKKGQSGNPKGRPRRAKTFGALLREMLNEKLNITENGRRRKITMIEATFKQLVNAAAKGDARARKDLLNMLSDLARLEREQAPRTQAASPQGAVVILPHNGRDPLDPELDAAYKKVALEHYAKSNERQNIKTRPTKIGKGRWPDLANHARERACRGILPRHASFSRRDLSEARPNTRRRGNAAASAG